jgi:hypothetical protein
VESRGCHFNLTGAVVDENGASQPGVTRDPRRIIFLVTPRSDC